MRTTSTILSVLLVALLVSAQAVGGDEVKKEDKSDQPISEVSGKVTLSDGKALPAGVITFHPRNAKDTVRVTIDDGKYVARSVPAEQKVRVTVEVEPINALAESVRDQLKRSEERAELLKMAKVDDKELMKRIKDLKDRLKVLEDAQKRIKGIKIPAAFVTKQETPLSVTVEPGKQTADFVLKE